MARTVQINHRSGGERSLHYSGSDGYGSRSPGPLKTTLRCICKLGARLGSLKPIKNLLEMHRHPVNPRTHSHPSCSALIPPGHVKRGLQPRNPGRPHTSAFRPSQNPFPILGSPPAGSGLPPFTLSTSRTGQGSCYFVSHTCGTKPCS